MRLQINLGKETSANKRAWFDRWQRRAHWMWAALAYLALTLAITDPVARQLTTRLAGQDSGDTLEFVWSIWWWQQALFRLHQSPANMTVLGYPSGQTFALLPVMSQAFLLAAPFAALFSPATAFNIVWLASFVLCGLAGYALCRDLSGDNLAGFVGGVVWVVFPNKMGQALGGHLFFQLVFSLALYTLALVRVLRRPTPRRGALAGLALALAATVHPIYIAYFLLPVTLSLVLAAWWSARPRRAFFSRPYLLALGLMVGIAGLIVAPLLAPAVLPAAGGQLAYLAERGATGFAIDGLSYFIPPPNNPFIQNTPLAPLAHRIVLIEFESIGYLGWAAMLLAGVGIWKRRAESKVWVVLGVLGLILALGPLLKLGGPLVQVPVEDGSNEYPLLMPYAFIGNLPLFQWSRTPGRWSILALLALSVLAAYGWAALRRPNWRRATQVVAVAGLTIVLSGESLVKFPMPTIAITQPAPVLALRAAPAEQAVITLPWKDNSANLRALYWQTLHQHPLVGGRVYRDLPGGYPLHDFLSRLLLGSEAIDSVQMPTDAQRRGVLAALHVNWVLVDARADAGQAAYRQVAARLGPPQSQDAEAALFNAPAQANSDDAPVWAAGGGWEAPVDWGSFSGRWLRSPGSLFVYSTHERASQLVFTAVPGKTVHRLRVFVNGQAAGRYLIGDWLEYQTDGIRLDPGLNQITFADDNAPDDSVGDPRCAGASPVSGAYPVSVPCDPSDRTARALSIVIGDVRLAPSADAAPLTLSGAQFGDALELSGYRAPASVKPGGVLALHLLWRVHQNVPADYTLFVHLINAAGAAVSQVDAQPFGSAYPTSSWAEQDVVADNVSLRIPADTAAGEYTLQLGWYAYPSLERLPVSGPNTHDNILAVARVRVGP